MIDRAYHALMPPYYTPRRDAAGAPRTDIDSSGKWVATRLPAIRVYGPFWSFGFNLYEPPQQAPWPDNAPALRGLRALAESWNSKDESNPPLAKPHYPTLLSAHVKSFLQVSTEELLESRMSLLAVRTIDERNLGWNGTLWKFDIDDFPVANEALVDIGTNDRPATLILAPFGDPQPKPQTTFKKRRFWFGFKEVQAVNEQHLPAMQLIHGQVRFAPTKGYLAKVRKALGLAAPSTTIDGGDSMVLMPDGFALVGAIDMPWIKEKSETGSLKDKSVSGWFKVTFRRLDTDKDPETAGSDKQPEDKGLAPVLRPWFDPEADNPGDRAPWASVIVQLEVLLRSAVADKQKAPRWLDIRPNVRLSAEDFFWPLDYEIKEDVRSILLHRRTDVVGIDGAGLLVRLADRSLAEAPLATLTIEPDAFIVAKDGNGFQITTETKLVYAKDLLSASYAYSGPPKDPPTETITVCTVLDDTNKTDRRVTLAVPMIETADSLRQAMGLARPAQKTNEAPVLPSLWAFTPLEEGWLHWPLPNATPGILSRLIGKEVPLPPSDKDQRNAADGISGAIMFGNRPGTPGYSPKERNWSFAIGEPRQATLLVRLELVDVDCACFTDASVELLDFVVSFDGVVPVTPFRQTPERLLPDHAERALATVGLRAVSPSSLNELERQLWDKDDRLRFAVMLDGLKIERAVDKDSDVGQNNVDARLSWSLNANKSDVPWIWVRHAILPAVQTMPLATAGKARNAPGEARALAPFIYEETAKALVYACKPGALSMRRATIALDPSVKGSVGAGKFRRPSGTRDKDGAPAEWSWRDELGMAVTTLPSLTLFAGLRANSPGIEAKGSSQWSSYPSYGVTVVARHDIALRDQFHALAVAPTKPEPGKEAPPPLALFTPRSDNAPDGDGATNGYDLVWTELSRKAGLAALDRRDMLAVDDKKNLTLVGVFGETSYVVGAVELDFTVGVSKADGAIRAVTQIGAWSLNNITGADPSSLRLAGLPDEGDLVGLSGSFRRGASGNVEVRYGTAVLKPQDNAFTDQHGIEVGRPSQPGPAGVIVKQVTNRALKETRELLTLVKPMPVANSEGLVFWCVDVPVGDGEQSFLAAYAKDHTTRINGASLDNDPFAGFRWTLANADTPGDVVVIDGFAFEPLALVGLTVEPGTKALKTVKIDGRLRLPVGEKDSPKLPRAGGSATLMLTSDGSGRLLPRLEGHGILWPLLDPQTATGFVPTLAVKTWPTKEEETATFTFGFADAVFSVELNLQLSTQPTELLTATLAGAANAPDTEFGVIATKKLELVIGRVKSGTDGKPILMTQHMAKIAFEPEIGRSEARLAAELKHDLLSPGAPNCITPTTFYCLAGIELDVELEKAKDLADDTKTDDDKGVDTSAAFAFGADHFALRWRLKNTKEKPRPLLLDGFGIAEGDGACFATLKVDTSTAALKSLPKIQVIGLEEELQFELTACPIWPDDKPPGKLQLVRRRRPGEAAPLYRLFGTFAIANAFSWPALKVVSKDDFEEALLPAEPAARFDHQAIVSFRGDVLQSEANGFMIAAAVVHTITKARETWTWQAHQIVRLLRREDFDARLAPLTTPPNKEPADIQKLDTGFSPLVGPTGAPLTEYAAVPHFLHVAASGPGGIAGPLADRLRKAIKAEGTNPTPFLAVDLSSHLLLDFRPGSASLAGPLILVSLPAIGFCLAKGGKLPWSNAPDIAEMLETKVDADTRILQSVTDGIAARTLPALEPAVASRLAARLGEASGRADESAAGALLAKEKGERSHHPVFQAVVLREDAAKWRPAWNLPGASTAMHLSALLVEPRSTPPVTLGFRPFGGISGDDLFESVKNPADHPLRDVTKVDVAVYELAMRRFRKRLLHDLVPGPGAVAPGSNKAKPTAVLLRLVARSRDGGGQRVIIEQRETISKNSLLTTLLDGAAEWTALGLKRLAPWASTGFASISIDEDGVQSGWSAIVRLAHPASGRTVWPQPIATKDSEMPAQRQLEQVRRTDTGRPRIVAGYAPLAAEPRLFTSEPDSTYGEEVPDYRLTATGVAMAWSLAGGTGAVLGDVSKAGHASAYWVTDRYRPAFRPYREAGPEITLALPADYDAALSGSLVPANHAAPRLGASPAPDQGTGTAQSFAPAIVTTSRISSRSGAMAATRTGLIAVVDNGQDRVATLDASQTPLSMRQPRPPILARNDRVRASSHEPGPFYLSRNPAVILHGPRAAPFGASALPTGLDRQPRSKFAMRLVLESPKDGIAAPDWNGEVTVAVDAVFGDADNATWTVKSAAIVIGSDRYAWKPVATELPTGKGQFSLVDFRGKPEGGGTEQSARDAMRAVSPATLAVLEITLAHLRKEAKEGNLLRQIRFDILSAGAGMSVPGVEAPLFFRFDDPEYNDQLQGLAKLARETSPEVLGEDFVFAADIADIRPGQRLELALALRPATPGAEITKKFEVKDGHLFYNGLPVMLAVERQRAGAVDATPLGSAENAMEGATAAKAWGKFLLATDSVAPTVFHAMKLDCSLLEAKGEARPALKPDDQLQLVLMLERERPTPEKKEYEYVPLVTLRFDVVATPDMPTNQSSFGFLMLKPDGKSVPVHLFASGPEATVIELVDPLDLVEGVVRRRAIYQWRSFHAAGELDDEAKAGPVRFALQKSGSAGGSWLPSEVEGGWLAAR